MPKSHVKTPRFCGNAAGFLPADNRSSLSDLSPAKRMVKSESAGRYFISMTLCVIEVVRGKFQPNIAVGFYLFSEFCLYACPGRYAVLDEYIIDILPYVTVLPEPVRLICGTGRRLLRICHADLRRPLRRQWCCCSGNTTYQKREPVSVKERVIFIKSYSCRARTTEDEGAGVCKVRLHRVEANGLKELSLKEFADTRDLMPWKRCI